MRPAFVGSATRVLTLLLPVGEGLGKKGVVKEARAQTLSPTLSQRERELRATHPSC
jgi:hypothetical protein